MARRRSLSWQYANHLCGGNLDAIVLEQRATGASWRTIARDIWTRTDQLIDLTDETWRRWYDEPNDNGADEAA